MKRETLKAAFHNANKEGFLCLMTTGAACTLGAIFSPLAAPFALVGTAAFVAGVGELAVSIKNQSKKSPQP